MIPKTTTKSFALLGPALLAWGCGARVCDRRNDSGSVLQSVPVAASHTAGLDLPGATNDGNVHRQTYSLGADGNFAFARTIETKVGYLGADLTTLDEKHAKRLGLEPFSGVLLRRVAEKGPADRAGLKQGDVITSFAGKGVTSIDHLEHLVTGAKPGEKVELVVERSGSPVQLTVELGSSSQYLSGQGFQRKLEVINDHERTGLKLVELTPETRPIVLGPGVAEGGVLVADVLPGGPGYWADLRLRDYVTRVGDRAVGTASEYEKAIQTVPAGEEVVFGVLREGERIQAEIEVAENATSEGGFRIPFLFDLETKPQGTDLEILLGGMLFNYESCFSVKRRDHSTKNASHRSWGFLLDLFQYEGRSDGGKRIRLLWIIPIWWGRD